MSKAIAQHKAISYVPRRIRYDLKSVINARATAYERERRRRSAGKIVIGRFVNVDGEIRFEAISEEPGGGNPHPELLTPKLARMYRWCTRQAAHQYLQLHADPRLQPVNLEQLRGREDPVDTAETTR